MIKRFDELHEILFSNISNGKPWLLFLVWPFGPEIQIGSQHLTWYYHVIILFQKGELFLVHTIKPRIYVQDNVLLTILDLPGFPNISPPTACHVQRCERLFQECLTSVTNMINTYWWC